MNELETVLYNVEGAVATVTMNRPKSMNAFNQQLRSDMAAALEAADRDAAVRVVVLTGAGRAFNPGA
ncbi:MAG: enoyl-CoA hydratase-related protein, partial [Pseudomonadota bacterium]